jgi:thiol:disulfide interchange protein DsbD
MRFIKLLLICCLIPVSFAQSGPDLKLDSLNSSASAALLNSETKAGVDFLPVKEAYRLTIDRNADGLLLHWDIAEGYYLYRHKFSFVATAAGNPVPVQASLPPGLDRVDEFFGEIQAYYNAVDIPLSLEQGDQPLQLKVTSQGCADAGLCYPPHDEYFEVPVGAGPITPILLKPGQQLPVTGSSFSTPLALILLMAVTGGVILNLMPCVFPVLSLKVVSFSQAKGYDHTAQRLHGLAYSGGVILSFVIIAAAMIGLKAGGAGIGWGFHLQVPWIIALLTYLFFVMGLSLSGLVEFGTSWMGLGNSLTSKPGYRGSFFTGMLATVVASPCTAPFMGTALGFAMFQTAPVALGIFAALGLGMALPFLLLAFFPGLTRFIPKPGRWLETFKQLMAFPLYAAAIWLLWVLGKQVGVNGMAIVLGGCVLLALAIWLWSRSAQARMAGMERGISLAALALASLLLFSPLMQSGQREVATGNENWQPYSEQLLQQGLANGQTVFVNVTADWCITCLANETMVLNSSAIKKLFADNRVIYLKGDWTNNDPLLTQLLNKYGRNGVPLYLLFKPGGNDRGEILPQLLTRGLMEAAIARKS